MLTNSLRYILVTLLLSFASSTVRSQEVYIINETRDETITSMGRDSSGRLFVSTLRGLLSYDGREVSEVIRDENVNDFVIDDDGNVWYIANNYIGRIENVFDIERYTVMHIPLSNLILVPGGRLAFTHSSGVCVFDMDSKHIVHSYEVAIPLKSYLLFDRTTGLFWLGYEHTLYALDNELNLKTTIDLPSGCQINSIAVSNSDKYQLLVATSRGLYAVSRLKEVRPVEPSVTGNSNILFLSISDDDKMTVCAVEGTGIFRVFDDLTLQKIESGLQLSSRTMQGFLMDRNHLWVSPDNSGVYSVNIRENQQSGNARLLEEFFLHKRIIYMGEDSSHGIWTLADGCVYWFGDGRSKVSKVDIPYVSGDNINSMLVTSDDRLVVTTPSEAYVFNVQFSPLRGELPRLKECTVSGLPVSTFLINELPDGKVVFRTITDVFILSPDGELVVGELEDIPLFSDPVRKIFVYNRSGRMTYLSSGQQIRDVRILPEGDGPNLVTVDSEERIWCITDNFLLYRISPFEGTIEQYDIPQWQSSSGDYSINHIFHSMQEDSRGNIWIGTSYGLVKVNPRDRHGFELYNTGRKYDYYKSSFKDCDGKLYFAYSNGLTVFDPFDKDNIASNSDIHFEIQYIIVNNRLQVYSPGTTCEFKYTDNTFTFANSYVDFDNLQTRFAWKLEGFDEDWKYNTYKYASYSSLPHGEYTFRLKMEGMPDSMAKSFSFVIRRKPWTSPTAISLYCIFGLLIGFISFKYFRERKKRQEKDRLQELKRQVDQMKLDVFTNLSHEFRTPLTLISVPLKDMLDESTPPDAVHRNLVIMQRNVEKLQRLTDQLLEYNKIDKDYSSLDLRRKDIVKDLFEIAENFQYSAQKDGSQITLSTPESLEFVYDDIKLGRIMSNLLTNAIKYSPDGGEISISAEMISPENASRIYGRKFFSDCLEIMVTDHGQGIPTDKLESIFDKYSRADESGYARAQGFGIGLHYTRQLVQAHGGAILAQHNGSEGSVFRFVFPEMPVYPEKKDEEQKISGESKIVVSEQSDIQNLEYVSGLNILVVDDNDDMRDYISDMFRPANNVTPASDGQRALEMARTQYFDLVISDVMMPVMDGYQFCQEIRQDNELCAVSIILLTAKTDTASQVHGLDIGADAFVSKPFDPQYLRALVNSIARRRSVRQDTIVRTTSDTIGDLPEEMVPENAFDRKLLADLYGILDKHLSQEEIDVNAIVREVGMSRTGFYMKVKALTGKSPLQFINEYRMSKAAELLKSGKYSIKEVSYMVGYQERRSFTSRFKATFGITPTEYVCGLTDGGAETAFKELEN